MNFLQMQEEMKKHTSNNHFQKSVSSKDEYEDLIKKKLDEEKKSREEFLKQIKEL